MTDLRRYRILHKTVMAYEGNALASHNELRMTPLTEPGQTTLENRIRVRPLTWSHVYRDAFGTHVMAIEALTEHGTLDIEASSTVERIALPAGGGQTMTWEGLAEPAVRDRHAEWLARTPRTTAGEALRALAEEAKGDRSPLEAAQEVAQRVHDTLEYRVGVTGVASSADEVWEAGSGVCQDFAHVTVAALRVLGIPARYVGGYLVPRAELAVGESSTGESHAWVECWVGEWVQLDPTNNRPVGIDHVVVARGRDYGDVPPMKGVYSGPESVTLDVSVTFTRLS
ncbi:MULTISPECIES: transglutaminase family protein [unclassified Janibacter]|uniref:transglutaminase family protein n=1 Tax=unclassified Janibacter TaxID=2649294 RepID=UPI003D07EF28